MYNKYFNFKLFRKHNFVGLSAEEICVLENEEDDFIFEYKKPQCLLDIVRKKLYFQNYEQYYICAIKISTPNSITDYKKIWKLCGFKKIGIYDGFYNCKNGRIYFGICEIDALPDVLNSQLNIIKLYVPVSSKPCFGSVIKIFKSNEFNSDQDEQTVYNTLVDLQESIDDSIVIYEFPSRAEVYVFGNNIENEFDSEDLPDIEIIEC